MKIGCGGSGGQRSEDEDGGCFREPEALIVEEDSNILETFAAEPIVDTTTDKSDSEELELMLVDVLAEHGVYTSDLKADIMRWHQHQMFMYPMTFSF